jgi:Tol biopolymer transport system component
MADVSDCSFARMPLSRMPIVLASGDPVSGRSSLYLLSSGAKCRLDINTTAFEPRWMPDEERILYAGIQGSRRDLFIWSFPQEISTLTTSSRSELGAVWAPDGRSVYFVAGEALQRLQMTTESPLASPQRVMNSFVAPEIAISPDGQSIAFISSQTARTALELVIDQELHISRLDGTGLRRLTYNTVRDSEPAWSSDGRWIAWVSDGQIWLYDLVEDASLPFTARSGFLASNPVWLPTGDGIAFIVQTANTRALVAQMFSGEFRIINGQFNRLTSFDWR